MIEYKRGPLDFHYSKTINPVNVGEREIAKMFCIALNLLRRLRREKNLIWISVLLSKAAARSLQCREV